MKTTGFEVVNMEFATLIARYTLVAVYDSKPLSTSEIPSYYVVRHSINDSNEIKPKWVVSYEQRFLSFKDAREYFSIQVTDYTSAIC